MITLYGFGRVFPKVIGETKDLRIQWALEELGLPYRVHGIDHTGGEHLREAYGHINCFRLLPAIEDDGFAVAESGAILLYLAQRAGRLIPADFQGRTRVTQWCFAALATVERPLQEIHLIDMFGTGSAEQRAAMVEEAGRWFRGMEQRLDGRDWIACDDFTVADLLLATVLRHVRNTDLLAPYPRITAYYHRALARPAWERTLTLYAERLSVAVDDIR
ncbi:glutathione S-transferase family protein [Chondromyces crocatus]|uniref:Glutathione S-transferase n=1 Tax=Chondromyces crocatus TaxID=52 RepID=A0A0K1EPI3_CHOCO|nr:glutathione S-transferase family protein [Chondromyces crocatus]AKT42830.1 glutathione S-transferase [Chondromyces crocatus]